MSDVDPQFSESNISEQDVVLLWNKILMSNNPEIEMTSEGLRLKVNGREVIIPVTHNSAVNSHETRFR